MQHTRLARSLSLDDSGNGRGDPWQIAVIQRWVDLGAKLDAGASSSAPLIQIMPKLPQPPAPSVYHVAWPVTALAFNPDGLLLASSGYHEVLLWKTADHSLAQRITNVAVSAVVPPGPIPSVPL